LGLKGNGIVAQSGGPTAVINSSVCGVIEEWLASEGLGTLYGAVHGIKGVLEGDFVNLSCQRSDTIKGLKYTPGAALGTCRHKLGEEDLPTMVQGFKKLDIRYFFYLGGNDSMDTANKVNQLALKSGYELKVIGVPKTIDNDLACTDHCPGYGSAAKYLATTVLETGLDLKCLADGNCIAILEAMGRHAGWLAGATALAKKNENDPPHLIYLPEVPFDQETFLVDVESTFRRLGHAYVVASEGLVNEKGEHVFAEAKKDRFGHVQLGGLANALKALVEKEIGVKTRANVLGTSQRAAMHIASRTDIDEAYMVGVQAVKLALNGESGLMVTMERDTARQDYHCRVGSVELGRVANMEKKVPVEWISDLGNGVTEEFVEYAGPLIQGEVQLPFKNGLPDYTGLIHSKETK